MKRIILIFAALLLCGCADETEDIMTESVTAAETQTELSFSFAQTEPPETEPTETSVNVTEPAENVLYFGNKNAVITMEFTGAESLMYYPDMLVYQKYRESDYVLHATVTVENLSDKSFDFIPQKFIISAHSGGGTGVLCPVTENTDFLVVSDKYYSVGAGEQISVNVDFIGTRKTMENADKIVYYPEIHRYNNIDAKELDNAFFLKRLCTEKRYDVSRAVGMALEITDNAALPYQFVPSDGDYVINTEKCSYCIDIDRVRPDGYIEDYIRADVKVRSLSGAQKFVPNGFRLVRADGKLIAPSQYCFDSSLAESPKEFETITIEGEKVIFMEYPFELYVHSDGTAEYYFFYRDGEYHGMVYEGENDSFEKGIEVR